MKLNSAQLMAVQHVDGPLLILAGAGTGKTRVITERTVFLVRKHDIAAENILCVTFTNKAAREMRERIGKRFEQMGLKAVAGSGESRKGRKKRALPMIATFHSLGLEMLRRYADRVGLRKNFSIYTTSEQLSVVRAVMREAGEFGSKPEQVHWRISRAKNAGTLPDPEDEIGEIARSIYEDYTRTLRQCNAVDFDDLLLLTLKLLETFPDVRDKYRARFRYIQVDEYQDTNEIQFRIIREIGGEHRNVCVVGDDDQSIYAWRGAQVKNILEFDKHFGGTAHVKVIRLEENYRSTHHILAAANAVIANNPIRAQKTLTAARGHGWPVKIIAAADETEEVRAVLMLVEKWVGKGDSLNQCAILFRTATLTRPFEEALRAKRIPYTMIGGQRYFERKEVRDTVSYLSLLVNDEDDAALLRIVNYPTRGIGKKAIDALGELAKERSASVSRTLRTSTKDELTAAGVPDSGARNLIAFAEMLAKYRWRLENGDPPAEVAADLVAEINIKQALEAEYAKDPAEVMRRQQNVQGVIDSLAAFQSRTDMFDDDDHKPSLSDYLERIALVEDQDNLDKAKALGRDALILITIHSCKGLEFKHVFVVGMEDGILPHKKTEAESDSGLDEERRLAYVAMTRAMDTLTLSYCLARQKFGRSANPKPSRFLAEIPPGCVEGQVQEVDRTARFKDFLGKLKSAID